jgi:hypothetical protein
MTYIMKYATQPLLILLFALSSQAQAQGLRDPMQMPGSLRPASSAHEATAPEIPQGAPLHRFEGPLSVLRINGQMQLVVGTRLMGVGQMLGGERIERISETEVWLRAGTQTRKLGFFEGVQRAHSSCLPDKACPPTPP